MNQGLSKLVNGELLRATLELKKQNDAPEKSYLDGINNQINSMGYKVLGTLQDIDNKNIYHVSIIKEDIC